MNIIKKTYKVYIIWLSIFVVISILAIIIKKVFSIQDFISDTNPVLVISPLLFILAMLLAYGIYDRILRPVKKNKNASEEEQRISFYKASKYKSMFLSFGGIIIALTLVLIWKKDYLYLLAIAFVLFLIAIPNKTKFNIEFSKYQEKNIQSKEEKAKDTEKSNQTTQ